MDVICTEMADVTKAGLVQVRKEERGGLRRQPWFTKKIAGQRRCTHKAEAKHCTSQNATSAEFLEVQIPLRILMYAWDP